MTKRSIEARGRGPVKFKTGRGESRVGRAERASHGHSTYDRSGWIPCDQLDMRPFHAMGKGSTRAGVGGDEETRGPHGVEACRCRPPSITGPAESGCSASPPTAGAFHRGTVCVAVPAASSGLAARPWPLPSYQATHRTNHTTRVHPGSASSLRIAAVARRHRTGP